MVSLHAAFAAMLLSATNQTVLLDFYADWCGPCKAMEQTVQSLELKGYPVQKVNIDKDRELAAKFGVRSVPCYVMLVNGQEVDRVMGGTTFSRLERMCKMTSPSSLQNRPPSQLAQQNTSFPEGSFAQPNSPPASRNIPNSFPRREDPNIIPASFVAPADARSIDRATSIDAKLLAASVRLRIEDADGNSCGSGTIIDSRNGEALILTCGHIFRDSQGKGKIDVDLFGPYTGQRIEGRLISYDLQRDVGLVAIRAPGPIAAARLAPAGSKINKGAKVASVGCDNGKDPEVRYSYVTSLNRYTGPANLQVAGQPTEGRSGGGLFSTDGMVVGVCNARDPQDQEGYYAALESICAQLDDAHLAFAYQSPQGYEGTPRDCPNFRGHRREAVVGENGTVPFAPPAASLASMNTQATPQNTPLTAQPVSMPNAMSATMGQPMSIPSTNETGLNPTEQAAMDEIRRRLKEGAEVVCVIRSRRDPQTKSEVIMLDKASPEFLQQLATETKTKDGRQETSLELPRPRQQPALEWSANPANAWRPGQ